MEMPTKKMCLELFRKYNIPKGIIRHSVIVNKVAVFLAKKLKSVGEDVDITVVDRASLLHDIGRSASTAKKHGEMGFLILKSEGFEKLGSIIRKHTLNNIITDTLSSWEEKIIYYADKRVEGDEIVSLNDRIEALKKRYTKHKSMIEKAKPLIKALEREIFERIGESPSIVNNFIKQINKKSRR